MLIHVCVHVCVLVCVAPPMVVGAWSMAGALQQLFEYYYYYSLMSDDMCLSSIKATVYTEVSL